MILDLYPYCLEIRNCGRSLFCISGYFLTVSVKDSAVCASFRLVIWMHAFLHSLDVDLYEFFCLSLLFFCEGECAGALMIAMYTSRNGLIWLIDE